MEKIIRKKANAALECFLGPGKQFRDGQYEAIEATLTKRRTLVVQRTGWGKSMVYFVCTKILRDEQKGLTLIISPLLSLMKNQIEAASKAGLKCEVLNSTKSIEEKNLILTSMRNDEVDLVLTTPETLFTETVQTALPNIKIGLFVVDEAHCISDWGHDFRLEYCRISKIIGSMLKNVPILATTATANNRVVEDLKMQLGEDVFVSRGPLMRKNLSIQILKMKDKVSRFAWIHENIVKIPGSGIIYCLTQNDCEHIASFLCQNDIVARAYHSGLEQDYNAETEQLFMDNKIKVIVATIKLGMGYDKSDISFVIHYQMPANVVAYYQQIGRAGRSINRAYTFLMFGQEDLDIQNYFIKMAFPSKKEAETIMNLIENNEGVNINDILSECNFPKGRVENALKFLVNEAFAYKEKSKYYASAKMFYYNEEHYNEIREIRFHEQRQMLDYLDIQDCFNRYVVNCLDDNTSEKCGICGNCLGYEEFSSDVSEGSKQKAVNFLEKICLKITPRKVWAKTDVTKAVAINKPNEEGICLSVYGEQGYGALVKQGKYENKRFNDKLVKKSAEVLSNFVKENEITILTYVPSVRSNIVKDFAERLALEMKLHCLNVLTKKVTMQQKEMENSAFQCKNALNSFEITEGSSVSGNVLLVDDIVDSKWTITVCGHKLMEAGASKVYPFALASSSKKEGC